MLKKTRKCVFVLKSTSQCHPCLAEGGAAQESRVSSTSLLLIFVFSQERGRIKPNISLTHCIPVFSLHTAFRKPNDGLYIHTKVTELFPVPREVSEFLFHLLQQPISSISDNSSDGLKFTFMVVGARCEVSVPSCLGDSRASAFRGSSPLSYL